jgi:hypothetical protein
VTLARAFQVGLFAATAFPSLAQHVETLDLLQFAAPPGQREKISGGLQFTEVRGNSYCRLAVFSSLASSGDPAADFEREWTNLAKGRGTTTPTPPTQTAKAPNGWIRSDATAEEQTPSAGRYRYRLVTFTGNGRRTAAAAMLNNEALCRASVDNFFAGLTPLPPAAGPTNAPPPPTPTPTPATGFAFTTTNFDDGWTATEQTDWVRAVKGNATVLIHHAQPDIRPFNNVDEATAHVWNLLVAPRYTNVSNLWVRRPFWSDGGPFGAKHFAEGDLTDKATGKRVHVALHRSGNGLRWLEFITPTRDSFYQQFGVVQPQDGTDWDRLASVANCNRFAVAARDLPGKWKSSSGAAVEYVNIYTGNSMGMASASSTTEITFHPDGTYVSVYKGVDGANGVNRYVGETFRGTTTVDRWEMKLTNRFKGATDTFAVQFEAVKGGRILHMRRGTVEELHLFRLP